jgi:hypothetical protein
MGMRASSRLNPNAEVFKIDEYHRGMAREASDDKIDEDGDEEDEDSEDEDEDMEVNVIKIKLTDEVVGVLNAPKGEADPSIQIDGKQPPPPGLYSPMYAQTLPPAGQYQQPAPPINGAQFQFEAGMSNGAPQQPLNGVALVNGDSEGKE